MTDIQQQIVKPEVEVKRTNFQLISSSKSQNCRRHDYNTLKIYVTWYTLYEENMEGERQTDRDTHCKPRFLVLLPHYR